MHKYKKLLSQIFITKNLIDNRVKPSNKRLELVFYIVFLVKNCHKKLFYCFVSV